MIVLVLFADLEFCGGTPAFASSFLLQTIDTPLSHHIQIYVAIVETITFTDDSTQLHIHALL